MSRKSKSGYIAEKRRAYGNAGKAERSRILNNAHVEQKNGSVVRELFGALRLDCQDLEPDLMRLEAEWSDYCNFFRPTKMIVSKTKKADGKGCVRKYQDGGPRTPYQRVLESGVLSEDEAEALAERYRRLNGVQLYQQAVRRLKRILRRQEAWRDRQRDVQRLLLDAELYVITSPDCGGRRELVF